MNKSFALIIDSTSKYSDVWIPYFGQLKKFFPKEVKKYLFTDKYENFEFDNLTPIFYSNDDSYRNQLLNCLKQVEEEFILYNSEDYILYDQVNMNELEYSISILENDSNYDFVKYIKGPERTFDYSENHPNIKIIDKNDSNFFAQQASIWRTKSLIKIFENSNPNNGRMQQEPGGSEICRRIGIGGLQYHTGKEIKRGQVHYDSLVFPCVATAITKGRWLTSEYGDILDPMFEEYKINPYFRGKI